MSMLSKNQIKAMIQRYDIKTTDDINSIHFVGYKDLKAVTADLKPI